MAMPGWTQTGTREGVPVYSMPAPTTTYYDNFGNPIPGPGVKAAGGAATNSTSTGYGGGINDLIKQLEDARNAANAKNESRFSDAMGLSNQQINRATTDYNDIVNSKQTRYTNLMGLVEGLGNADRSRTRQDWGNNLNSGMANLSARGLSGTTMGGSLRQSNQKGMDQSLQSLEEGLRRERIGYDTALGSDVENAKAGRYNAWSNAVGGQMGLLERRNDVAPDYTNLVMGLGAQSGRTVAPMGFPGSNMSSSTRVGAPIGGSAYYPLTGAPSYSNGTPNYDYTQNMQKVPNNSVMLSGNPNTGSPYQSLVSGYNGGYSDDPLKRLYGPRPAWTSEAKAAQSGQRKFGIF